MEPAGPGVLAHPWDSRHSKREQSDKLLQSLVRKDQNIEVDKEVVTRVARIAEQRSVSMAVVALAWCFFKDVQPITGLGSKERIDEAVASVGFKLDDEEIAYLEEPYRPKEVAY